jgi:uracil-DNA glycosylase family 4
MDARRADYLRTLGIDVWVPRTGAVVMEKAAESVAPVMPAAPQALSPTAVPSSRRRQALSDSEIAAQWQALKAEVAVCTRCSLHATRTQTVFGVGNERADWLIIGEAPGADEDRKGEPFVGRGGQLLDSMLRAIGVRRGENAYIANILKSRPPGNRDPRPEEVAVCMPYLLRQIALIAPRIILSVGRISAQNLLATDTPIGRLRGRLHHFGELNTPLVVTYHPAYLLRSPGEKRKAWEDLKFARSVVQQSILQES